jgi:hypothetical protein
LLVYLARNEDTPVHYAARRRRGEPISTAFVESAVNEIVAKRRNKKQQMRWNRATVQPFLDERTAVLNDARGRFPQALFRIPPRERRKADQSSCVMNPTGLHAPGPDGTVAFMSAIRAIVRVRAHEQGSGTPFSGGGVCGRARDGGAKGKDRRWATLGQDVEVTVRPGKRHGEGHISVTVQPQ